MRAHVGESLITSQGSTVWSKCKQEYRVFGRTFSLFTFEIVNAK